jgi:hypothetical protein
MLHLERFNDGLDFFHDMRVVNDCHGFASPENALPSVRRAA